MQLAAATATNGTQRPMREGSDCKVRGRNFDRKTKQEYWSEGETVLVYILANSQTVYENEMKYDQWVETVVQ